jgi:hypothetical protein
VWFKSLSKTKGDAQIWLIGLLDNIIIPNHMSDGLLIHHEEKKKTPLINPPKALQLR